jgi:hypothetical protein
MDERQRRMAQNEALFRKVNERVNDLVTEHGATSQQYVCECATPDCNFYVELDGGEYEAVRGDPTLFIVLPLHYTPEVETLDAKHERYWIVRKIGETAEFVEQHDPRAR